MSELFQPTEHNSYELVDSQGNVLPSHDVWYQNNGLYVPYSVLPKALPSWITVRPSNNWGAYLNYQVTEPEPDPVPPTEHRAEVVEGWRSYSIDYVGRQLVLNGLYGSPWWKRYMYAVCGTDRKAVVEHLKANSCSCGIYGHGEPSNGYEANVTARVRTWGVVLTDSNGNFRASEAEITELYVSKEMETEAQWVSKFINWGQVADLLRDRYAVPVHVVESIDDIEEKEVST